MGTPANIIDVTVHYARILFVAIPVLFLYFVYTTFMRGTGDSKTPFTFSCEYGLKSHFSSNFNFWMDWSAEAWRVRRCVRNGVFNRINVHYYDCLFTQEKSSVKV